MSYVKVHMYRNLGATTIMIKGAKRGGRPKSHTQRVGISHIKDSYMQTLTS